MGSEKWEIALGQLPVASKNYLGAYGGSKVAVPSFAPPGLASSRRFALGAVGCILTPLRGSIISGTAIKGKGCGEVRTLFLSIALL